MKFFYLYCLLLIISFAPQQATALRSEPIINGEEAEPHSAPWIAALFDSAVDDLIPFCGGSIIGPRIILTAAHCVENYVATSAGLNVRVGLTSILGTEGYRIGVRRVIIHPSYNPWTSRNDLAVLVLASSLSELSGVSAIKIASADESVLYRPGADASIWGWGTTDSMNPVFPDHLQVANVPIVPDSVCLGSLGLLFDPATMLCAGVLSSSPLADDGVDSCSGDSGGAITVTTNTGENLQIGVTSWGFGCASHKTYGVYADATLHSEWVNSFVHAPRQLAPLFITRPFVEGIAAVGATLRCNPGIVQAKQPVHFSYTWTADDRLVSESTDEVLVVQRELAGQSLKCQVVASNRHGEVTSDSLALTPIVDGFLLQNPYGLSVELREISYQEKTFKVKLRAKNNLGTGIVSRVRALMVRKPQFRCPGPAASGRGCVQIRARYVEARKLRGQDWELKLRRSPIKTTLFVQAIDVLGSTQRWPTQINIRRNHQ